MSEFGQRAEERADNYCYRHPDRRSFVLCQRCGATICGDCQTPAPVGVLCPDCVARAKGASTSSRTSVITLVKRAAARGTPVVTYAIIALTVLVYVVQFVTDRWLVLGWSVTSQLLFNPVTLIVDSGAFSPWRMLTSTLVHGSLWHIGFNMLTLWLFGRVLEPLFGRLRFLLLWVAAGLGGSLAVVLLDPTTSVIGASGAVFGLFGAYFVVMRHARMNPTSLIVLIGINLVMGFIVPGIAWQAHVGGLVIGVLAGWLLSRDVPRPRVVGTDGRSRRAASGAVLVGVLAVAIVVVAVVWMNVVVSVVTV